MSHQEIPPARDGSDSEGSDHDDIALEKSMNKQKTVYEQNRQRIEEEVRKLDEELKTTPYKVLLFGDPGNGQAKLLHTIRDKAVAAGVEQPKSDGNPASGTQQVKYVQKLQAEYVHYENLAKPTILFEMAENEERHAGNLASMSHGDVDAVLLCFSVNDRSSFDNVQTKWSNELGNFCPDVPTTLVGLTGDSASTPSSGKREIAVKPSQARKLSRKMGSQAYVDCSALMSEGDDFSKLLAQCASDARYGRLLRRRNLTGTQAREGDPLPERIMLYTMGAFALGPSMIFAGIGTAGEKLLGLKPLLRKAREHANRPKLTDN